MIRFGQSWPWWRWILTGLSGLALALSAYLGWHYLMGGSVIGCEGGSPCNQVLNSRWSAVGGVLPVSGLAAGVYLAMLTASLFIGPATQSPVRRLAWRAMLVMVGAIAGSAVWFIFVQDRIIGAFCPYCMATHVAGLLLAVLVLWRAPMQLGAHSANVARSMDATTTTPDQDVSRAGSRRVIGLLPVIGPVLVGLALAGILAACEVGFAPRTVYRDGQSQVHLPVLNPHAVPLIGSPDAPYVVTLLFDYNCPHCQRLHFMLKEAVDRYGGKLAFALCPAPLNSHCNPYVPRDVGEFADSCELAKIGLAVWLAKRKAFPVFDTWMYSFDSGDHWQPRSLDAAKAKAIELVGQAKFDAAMSDPWVARYLQTSIGIFGDTGGRGVPKLVFGSRWVIPEPRDAEDFILILHDNLGLPRP